MEATKQLFNRLTGLWPESVSESGRAFRCTLATEEGEAEMEVRLLPAETEAGAGAGAGASEDEDEIGLIEV